MVWLALSTGAVPSAWLAPMVRPDAPLTTNVPDAIDIVPGPLSEPTPSDVLLIVILAPLLIDSGPVTVRCCAEDRVTFAPSKVPLPIASPSAPVIDKSPEE